MKRPAETLPRVQRGHCLVNSIMAKASRLLELRVFVEASQNIAHLEILWRTTTRAGGEGVGLVVVLRRKFGRNGRNMALRRKDIRLRSAPIAKNTGIFGEHDNSRGQTRNCALSTTFSRPFFRVARFCDSLISQRHPDFSKTSLLLTILFPFIVLLSGVHIRLMVTRGECVFLHL